MSWSQRSSVARTVVRSARGRLFGDGFDRFGGRFLSGLGSGFRGGSLGGGGFSSHRLRGQFAGQGGFHRSHRSAQIDARRGLAGGQTVQNRIRDQVAVQLQGARGVIVTRDRIGDAVWIAVGVQDRDDRDVQLASRSRVSCSSSFLERPAPSPTSTPSSSRRRAIEPETVRQLVSVPPSQRWFT
jgi:hypothetical protein